MRDFYKKVSQTLEKLAQKDYGVTLEHPLWEVPSKQDFGDLSSMVALKLASRLKKDPLEIAGQLKVALEKLLSRDIEKIEVLKPGFVNIFISKKVLIDSLNEILNSGQDFFRGNTKRKTLIEFLSANPTGPLSIAHGRQAVIGDTIARILEFCGNKVEREYYLNDAGRQIDLFISSVESWCKQIKGEKGEFPEGGYKGEYVKELAQDFIAKGGKDKIDTFAIESMIGLIKQDLEKLDIRFDSWFSQKSIIEKGKVNEAIESLRKKELIYEKEGAVWFASTKLGDDKDRVVKKADGELTYFASDIAYHNDKAKRNFDELINLWGPDHHGYIKRVKTAIWALGYREDILKILIIQLVTLKTKERMSKRAGTFISLSDLISDVGKDATRFYYLTRKNSSHLEFDIDLAKEASFDNPLYYIQYVCARIESIFKKALPLAPKENLSSLLAHEEEMGLLRTLLQFSYCLEKAYYSLEPVFIIEFLKNLAAQFHKFYERVRVIEDDKDKTCARLNLLQGVKTVFHCGLSLLGITPVEKM
jgi:arginyl-tRNA synthetase